MWAGERRAGAWRRGELTCPVRLLRIVFTEEAAVQVMRMTTRSN